MKNNLKTVVLLATMSGVLVGLGSMVGRGGAMFGLAFALVMNVGSYWFSDKLALKMSKAKPVSEAEAPELYSSVRRLTQGASLPMPSLYIIPSDQPNAFATGRNPEHAAVAVTRGIMQTLDREELEGVLAHELAHVRNRDILIASVAATIAAAISFIAVMARWGAIFSGGGRDNDGPGGLVSLLVASIVAPISAVIIQMAVSRSREFRADAIGAQIAGHPQGLASALRKLEAGAKQRPMNVNQSAAPMYIVNPLRGPLARGASKLFSTHPPTEERIARLEKMTGQSFANPL
ncbi:MAG: zinc metalloprotease HtpX [Actinobacteria bacterium]|nr:zinc metalloprotease HtpX [Actinomycetota bacterium]